MPLYKKLSVWRKAHTLVLRVHTTLASFGGGRSPSGAASLAPLAAHLRRTAQAIPVHIALGAAAEGSAPFAAALDAAMRCARTLDYHLLLARDLTLLSSSEHATLEARNDEVTRMLVALRRTVVARTAERTTGRPRNGSAPSRTARPRPAPGSVRPTGAAERVLRQKPGREDE